MLKKDKKTFNAIDWTKEFKKADDLQYPELTSHQRHLFHLLKEESIQSENLKNAFEKEKENLKKQKRTLQDILFINPIKDKDGLTLACCAVQQKDRTAKDYFYETISQYYAQHITKIDSKGNNLLHWAVYFDQSIEIIELLISETNADLKEKNTAGKTLLHYACANGHVEIVKYLIEKDPDLAKVKNKDGNALLHLACANGYIQIVKYLIKKNPDSAKVENNNRNTPLFFACQNDHVEIARLLLEKNSALAAEKDKYGNTLLHLVCGRGHLKIARLLLKVNPALATEKGKYGITPLWACDLSKKFLYSCVNSVIKVNAIIKEADSKSQHVDSARIQIGKILESYANPSFFSQLFSWRHHKNFAVELSQKLLNSGNEKQYANLSACKALIKEEIDKKGKENFEKYGTFYSLYRQIKNLPEKVKTESVKPAI